MDVQQKVAIIRCYYSSSCSETAAIRLYKQERGLHNDPFDAKAVRRVISKFEAEGCVAHRSSGSGRPQQEYERVDDVVNALSSVASRSEFGTSSTTAISQATGIPRSSVHRILRHKLNLWPYHLQLKHHLEPQDLQHRVEFADWFLDNMVDSLSSILWTDEAYFRLNGEVNTHNAVIWAKEKTDQFHRNTTSSSKKSVGVDWFYLRLYPDTILL
jgi:hypothetical protein